MVLQTTPLQRAKDYFARHRRPDPSNRDPNYLTPADLASDCPWYVLLGSLRERCDEIVAAAPSGDDAAGADRAVPSTVAAPSSQGSGELHTASLSLLGVGFGATDSGEAKKPPQPSPASDHAKLRATVLFDVHGAGGTAVDLYVGLGALEEAVQDADEAYGEGGGDDEYVEDKGGSGSAGTNRTGAATPNVRRPTRAEVDAFRAALKAGLDGLLGPLGFVVDASPHHKFQGAWGHSSARGGGGRLDAAPGSGRSGGGGGGGGYRRDHSVSVGSEAEEAACEAAPASAVADTEVARAATAGNTAEGGLALAAGVGGCGDEDGGVCLPGLLPQLLALDPPPAPPPPTRVGSTQNGSQPSPRTPRGARFTVGQQAVRVGFRLAAQLELSRALRKRLNADRELRGRFVRALLEAARVI